MIKDITKIFQQANKNLSTIESELIEQFESPQKPVFFIVGAPRSGTTVLLQTIIDYYNICYINNLIAKFWDAPVFGSLLYQSLDLKRSIQSFKSDSGFTDGVEGPHEFGYFWKRFFKYGATHQIEESEYPSIDNIMLKKEIAGLEEVCQNPIIFKNPPALSLQINFLEKYIPNSHFIYIKREMPYIAQSIYLKRIEKLGNIKEWYSTKPKEYRQLILEPPINQIAGQVYYISKKIEKDLEKISNERKTIIHYEDFCVNPIETISTCRTLSDMKKVDKSKEASNLKFTNKNEILLDQDIWKQLNEIIDKLHIKV